MHLQFIKPVCLFEAKGNQLFVALAIISGIWNVKYSGERRKI